MVRHRDKRVLQGFCLDAVSGGVSIRSGGNRSWNILVRNAWSVTFAKVNCLAGEWMLIADGKQNVPRFVHTLKKSWKGRRGRKMAIHKNKEGYPDPTAGEAVRRAQRMPKDIYEIYKALNTLACFHGLELLGVRDKKTKREWRK